MNISGNTDSPVQPAGSGVGPGNAGSYGPVKWKAAKMKVVVGTLHTGEQFIEELEDAFPDVEVYACL